jgi:type II secretion system protein G
MKKAIFGLLAAVFVIAAFAQETEKQKKTREALEKRGRITMMFQDADLSLVIGQILGMQRVDVAIDEDACKGLHTTFQVNNATPAEALKTVLGPHNLDYIIRKDGSVYVSTKEKIAKLKGEGKEKKKADLKAGELLLLLRDGTKVKGKVSIDKWNLETAYGKLTIPTSDVKKVWPAGKAKKGADGKEKAERLTEDKIETVRFTVTGKLEIDKLEVDTGKGKLSIPVTDIKEILFPGVKPVKPLDERTLARIRADFKAIQDAIGIFKMDTATYPVKLEDLVKNPGIARWRGPYLRREPLDAWERPYVYEVLGRGPFPYELKTYGADGKEGGEGENKDLSNLDFLKDK